MEEQLSSLAVTHLLQHTLRSLCIHENSQWVYAVFWRILPRNYPPPKWDSQGGAYDRSRGNRRNWILVWEDGFCNFAASSAHEMNNINGGDHNQQQCPNYGNSSCDYNHQGLQPELFFKMSHEIYNYGEGLIGKVAADHSHKWIYKEPNNQENNFLSAWHNSADSHPRTWEAQFQSGIKTIALIAVREGVIQLGAVQKVIEDLSYVVLLRKKFSYIESIPGVLLPHPSSSPYPFIKIDAAGAGYPAGTIGGGGGGAEGWQHFHHYNNHLTPPIPVPPEFYDHYNINHQQQQPMKIITPSMSSLEALLSKLPSVVMPASTSTSTSPPPPQPPVAYHDPPQYVNSSTRSSMEVMVMGMEKVAKEEEEFDKEDNHNHEDDDDDDDENLPKKNKKNLVGDHDQTRSSVSSYHHQNQHFGNYHHQDLNHVSHESMHSHGY